MKPLALPTRYPGVSGAVLGGIVGYVLQGMDTAALAILVGFFAGKSLQSLVWTLRGPSGT